MLVLNAKDIQTISDMTDIIESVETALSEYSFSRTITPIRTVLPVAKSEGSALVMPSLAEEAGSLGMKFVSVFPNNKAKGKKAIYGVVLLADVETGEPIALLEGSELTVLRTGALSGLATKYLSRHSSKSLCIIGTGEQAKGLCDAVLAVREIEMINLYNRSEKKAHDFAKYVEQRYHVNVSVYKDPDKAIDGADIIVTATNAKTPVFSKALKQGVHINAVGSFRPTMQELPSKVISNADKVVVEAKDAALEETGDLQIPIQEGAFGEDRIYAELGQIVNNDVLGRENEKEITVFKSVGLAVADIVVAKHLYEKALDQNIGQQIEF